MIKKISIIALCLLLIGLIGSIFTFKSMLNEEEITDKKVFNGEDITKLDVKADNADVEIISTQDTKTTVELSGMVRKHKKYSFTAKTEGKTLAVKLKSKRQKLLSLDFFSDSIQIKVFVPEKAYDSLNISLGNGKVFADGLQVKTANAETINGKIDMKNINSTNIKVRSENGRIVLDNVDGELIGDVTNGSISLIANNLERPIDFKSVNGKISIQTESEPENATFDVKVVNGKVDIFGNSVRNSIIGTGDPLIKLSTVNGSIIVTK